MNWNITPTQLRLVAGIILLILAVVYMLIHRDENTMSAIIGMLAGFLVGNNINGNNSNT